MAAAAQNFMENPVVKGCISLALSLLGALILWACSSMADGIKNLTTKVDNVQSSLSTISTALALTQREVKGLDESQRATATDVKQLTQDVLVLKMRVDQIEKRGR
jgi:hypothetical protein